MDNVVDLTDEQIEEIFADCGVDLDIEEVVFTHSTIDDFIESRKKWAERGILDRSPYKGLDIMIVERGQPRKGMPRGDTIVIDLGDRRAVYSDHTIR